MTGISDLYQDILLDHNSKPRNFRKPDAEIASLRDPNVAV